MKYLIFILSVNITLLCLADEDPCKNALYNANKLYENGKFQEAITILQPCVANNDLHGDEKFDATRLVALCYTYLNEVNQAEKYTEKMLKIRPDYQKYPYVDPGDFRSVLNRFVVTNKLDIGLGTGINFNQVRIIKNYSVANTPSTYTSKAGFHAGIIAEYHHTKKISVLFQPNRNTMRYLRDMENVAGSKKEYTELIMNLEIPVSCRMYFGKGMWRFYGQAGLQWDYLLKSFADVQSTNLLDESVFQSSTETTPYRNRSNFGFNAGLGASTSLGKGIFSIGLSCKYFFPNLAVPDKRYDNVDFILSSQYIDSDFNINSLSFNISYQLPFLYSVKKIRG